MVHDYLYMKVKNVKNNSKASFPFASFSYWAKALTC